MIPRSVLDDLKCSFCKNNLSIFPIHTFGDKNTITCGRCPLQKDFLPQREILYEELAQYIEFPCQYQSSGCIEKLKPAELQLHEIICPHKPCVCPILPLGECKWKGNYDELYEHYADCHPVLALKDFRVEIDLVNTYEENYVFRQSDETFIAQLKCESGSNLFYCNVRFCGPSSVSKKFTYLVCFTDNKNNFRSEIHGVSSEEIGSIMTNNTTTVNINDIVTKLQNPVIVICKIEIIVKNLSLEQKNNVALKEETELLKMLECPVCFDYMVPPILQCNTGHSFCKPCRQQLTNCPTCEGAVGEIRNYALENITNVMEYPCKYSKFDCTFSGIAKYIKTHEATCIFGPYQCIIDTCPWKGKFSNLKSHLRENHKDNLFEMNPVVFIIDPDLVEETVKYITMQYDNIFILVLKKQNDTFSWALQIVSSEDIHKKYMLELDFESRCKEKLYIRKRCGPMVEFSIVDDDYRIALDMGHLKYFIDDDILTFKFRVVEIK